MNYQYKYQKYKQKYNEMSGGFFKNDTDNLTFQLFSGNFEPVDKQLYYKKGSEKIYVDLSVDQIGEIKRAITNTGNTDTIGIPDTLKKVIINDNITIKIKKVYKTNPPVYLLYLTDIKQQVEDKQLFKMTIAAQTAIDEKKAAAQKAAEIETAAVQKAIDDEKAAVNAAEIEVAAAKEEEEKEATEQGILEQVKEGSKNETEELKKINKEATATTVSPVLPVQSAATPVPSAPPATNEPKVVANEPKVAANVQNVAANVPKVAPNVAANVPKVAANVPKVAANVPKVAPNVAANVPKVAANEPNVAANEPNVAANVPKVAANVPNVAANEASAPKVAANVPKVAANVPKVAANVPKVAANVPKVAADKAAAEKPAVKPAAVKPPAQSTIPVKQTVAPSTEAINSAGMLKLYYDNHKLNFEKPDTWATGIKIVKDEKKKLIELLKLKDTEYSLLPKEIQDIITKEMYDFTIPKWETLNEKQRKSFFDDKEKYNLFAAATATAPAAANKYYKQSNNFNEVATLKSLNYY
jgi:hypothetical protein